MAVVDDAVVEPELLVSCVSSDCRSVESACMNADKLFVETEPVSVVSLAEFPDVVVVAFEVVELCVD